MQCMAESFTKADAAELAFRVELVATLVKALQQQRLEPEALADEAHVSLEELHRIQEGSVEGISTDTLIRILGAAGYLERLQFFKSD